MLCVVVSRVHQNFTPISLKRCQAPRHAMQLPLPLQISHTSHTSNTTHPQPNRHPNQAAIFSEFFYSKSPQRSSRSRRLLYSTFLGRVWSCIRLDRYSCRDRSFISLCTPPLVLDIYVYLGILPTVNGKPRDRDPAGVAAGDEKLPAARCRWRGEIYPLVLIRYHCCASRSWGGFSVYVAREVGSGTGTWLVSYLGI